MSKRGQGSRRRLGLTLLVSAIGCAGCNGDDDATTEQPSVSPEEAVATAGAQAMDGPGVLLNLRTRSGESGWEVEGPVQLGRGRFSVDVLDIENDRGQNLDTVIGFDGEGFETTVQETHGGLFGRKGGRCWFNPHAPVGSYLGTVSIEEGVRLTGAIIESLQRETASAREAEESIEVALRKSASKPGNDFRETKQRVWGDRASIEHIDGPIAVTLDEDGDLSEIYFELSDFRTDAGFNRRGAINHAVIKGSLRNTNEKPEIDPPGCQAIE